MSRSRVFFLTLIAMTAFAGNSLLCRLALTNTAIDAASFTSIRIISGALMLWLLVGMRSSQPVATGSWCSALALFLYAAGFSFAYVSLPVGTGALLLFAAGQVTMIGYGLWGGERLGKRRITGYLLALGGLVGLLLPGVAAPPLHGAALMMGAGVAWGIYSLRGSNAGNATCVTASNFLRALPFAVMLSLVTLPAAALDMPGVVYAITSGALASGVGYAVWYTALQGLQATSAATVQLSVPVIAAIGGLILLGEPLTERLLITSIAILGGIALVVLNNDRAQQR